MNTLLESSIAALHLVLKYWHVELFFYGGQTTTVKIYHSVSIAQGKYWEVKRRESNSRTDLNTGFLQILYPTESASYLLICVSRLGLTKSRLENDLIFYISMEYYLYLCLKPMFAAKKKHRFNLEATKCLCK